MVLREGSDAHLRPRLRVNRGATPPFSGGEGVAPVWLSKLQDKIAVVIEPHHLVFELPCGTLANISTDRMTQATLVYYYDVSCPFAYIASTRVKALADRTNAKLVYRPVLLGAIYRSTAAPQGAAGSASDVFNPTKKSVTARSMQRTLKR
jgi:hypothetical protein